MANTSATGGYLLSTQTPVDDEALENFIQTVIVGVTGLPGSMVRPAFQPNPPKRPNIGTDWCGFSVSSDKVEAGYAYNELREDGLEQKQQRHEDVVVRCSFYGPNCGRYSGAFRDGLEIPQNREQLFLVGMKYAYSGAITKTGELVDEKWYRRADITATFRRQLDRTFAVLSFVAANGTINTETMSIGWATRPEE
jgi:hypothetical protein